MSDKHLNSLDAYSEEVGDNVSNDEQELDLSGNWLDMSKDYPEPRYLLQYNGVGFFPLGGIQAITGQKKNGKSFLVGQFMAAALGSTSLEGLQLSVANNIPEKPNVLYCDTEMEIENTSLEAKRVHYLCGFDFHINNPRFSVLWLRKDKPDVRWKKIKQAIKAKKPDMLVIDGIRDVVPTVNDETIATNLMNELMEIASDNDCCILNVLHENKGGDQMRGWLGTELGTKCSDTFRVTKDDSDENNIVFKVKQVDARGKQVHSWTFIVDDTRCKFGIPVITSAKDLDADTPLNREERNKLMEEIFLGGKSLSRTAVIKEIIRRRFVSGSDTSKARAEQWFKQAEMWCIIGYNSDKRQFYYQGLDPLKPNAAEQDLPY